MNHSISSVNFIPSWNNILLQTNLRKFITLTTRTESINKFLNLNRNGKYRKLPINLELSLKAIQGSGEKLYTDFKENKERRHKIQLLIEETPCLEQVKKSLYSLYKNRKCPFCAIHDEDFNHIWLCPDRIDELNQLKEQILTDLINIIENKIDSDETFINIDEWDLKRIENIWEIKDDPNTLTFIDQIKGIVPLSLSNFIQNLSNKKQITADVILTYRDTLFKKTWDFWLERCDKLLEIDNALGINKQIKKQHFHKESYNTTRKISSVSKYEDLDSIRNSIYFGHGVLDFTI